MHHWQDLVLAIGSIIFSVALIPTVLSEHKPAVATSLSTAIVLFVFALTYASLHLWFSTVTTCITATLWTIIALQKLFRSPTDSK